MKKNIFILLFLIIIFILTQFIIFAEKIILKSNKGPKYLFINEINNWNNINEYIHLYKKIKNYELTEDKDKSNCVITIKVNKILFKLINYQNEYDEEIYKKKGEAYLEDRSVESSIILSADKNEQSVFFEYLIELKLNYKNNQNYKIININERFNISYSKKEIKKDYINENEEYLIYLSKDYNVNNHLKLNITSNEVTKFIMNKYYEDISNEMSKKIVEYLIKEL